MDQDLDTLSHSQLLEVAKKMRQAIRSHRDSQLHDLCWYHPEMWNLLPDTQQQVQPLVPNKEQFLRGCEIYRESLDRSFPKAHQVDVSFIENGSQS